jgi:hypothetical protein
MCPSQVSATQTFTSGKRNDLEDLRIIQFHRPRPLGTYDWKNNPHRAASSVPLQFLLHAAQNKFLDRTTLASCFALEFAIKRVRNIDCCSHLFILPYLWLLGNRRNIVRNKAKASPALFFSKLILDYLLPPLVAGACAVVAFVIVSGRFNSNVSCVPAGNIAE